MASFIPKVSVILPVYQKNNEYLDLSVESILGQSLKEFELIIIANNCDEKLWESLQKFNEQRVRLYRTVIEQIAFNLNCKYFAISLPIGSSLIFFWFNPLMTAGCSITFL